MDSFFPNLSGTYALILHASSATSIRAGALGQLAVEPGWYLYVGSAFGPGGLRGRMMHHLNNRPARWHIDALKTVAPIQDMWYCTVPVLLEHIWAQACLANPNLHLPWKGFGASDCRCSAHLFYSVDRPTLAEFEEHLKEPLGSVSALDFYFTR
jgi:Uri superfamily endonuclease